MAHEPYVTSVYPYPAAMWDEAADQLAVSDAWETVLIVCPNIPETVSTAISEMAARGVSDAYADVYYNDLTMTWTIRVSHLMYLHRRWDQAKARLLNSGHFLVVVDATEITPAEAVAEAQAAMAERGLAVSVGMTIPDYDQAVLRLEVT